MSMHWSDVGERMIAQNAHLGGTHNVQLRKNRDQGHINGQINKNPAKIWVTATCDQLSQYKTANITVKSFQFR